MNTDQARASAKSEPAEGAEPVAFVNADELDNMLDRAATNQERELDSMMGALVGLLGPLLIVVMGMFVMGIVFAMLMPIFEMNNLIR